MIGGEKTRGIALQNDAMGGVTRSWAALRANLKQELLAPVVGLLQYSEMLLEGAEAQGHNILLNDLKTVRDSCVRLHEVVDGVLGSVGPPGPEREIRHNLCNLLNPVIQCSEMLIEDATSPAFLEVYGADLRAMIGLAKHLLHRTSDLLTFPQGGEAGVHPLPVEAVLDCLPPCLVRKVAPPQETGSILVVDDNDISRSVLRRQLEREGHRAAAAADGRAALQMLREQSFDLVLLDILMPEMGGFETLLRLKADPRLSTTPVIVISGLEEVDSAARCIQHGAEDYLTKPCNKVLLHARICACLEKKRLRDREAVHLEEIRRSKERVDELLRVILPHQVVPELIASGRVRPRRVDDVAVLFADLVGFTRYCGQRTPEQVVDRLQHLVEGWEEIAQRHRVLKIKTIGDALMAACGLFEEPADDPVLCAVRFGLDLISATRRVAPEWSVRVGIHVGPVVAGIVGRRQYLFDLWGDTVNTAARMESHGRADAINLSPEAWARVVGRFQGVANAANVKSIGWTEMMLLPSPPCPQGG